MATVSAPAARASRRRDGRRAGAGAAAHAGGDEDHVGALDQTRDQVTVFLGRLPPDGGIAAGAEAASELRPDREHLVGARLLERLGIGVDGVELDAGEARLDHAVDGIAAGAADAQHLDLRESVGILDELDIQLDRLLREIGPLSTRFGLT